MPIDNLEITCICECKLSLFHHVLTCPRRECSRSLQTPGDLNALLLWHHISAQLPSRALQQTSHAKLALLKPQLIFSSKLLCSPFLGLYGNAQHPANSTSQLRAHSALIHLWCLKNSSFPCTMFLKPEFYSLLMSPHLWHSSTVPCHKLSQLPQMRSHSRLGKRAKIKPKHVVSHWRQTADLLLKILALVRALPFKSYAC